MMCSLRRLQVYIYHFSVLFSCRMACCICSSPPTFRIKSSRKSRERKWIVYWTAEQQSQSINASASCLHQQMISERGLFSSGRRMFGGAPSQEIADRHFVCSSDGRVRGLTDSSDSSVPSHSWISKQKLQICQSELS